MSIFYFSSFCSSTLAFSFISPLFTVHFSYYFKPYFLHFFFDIFYIFCFTFFSLLLWFYHLSNSISLFSMLFFLPFQSLVALSPSQEYWQVFILQTTSQPPFAILLFSIFLPQLKIRIERETPTGKQR